MQLNFGGEVADLVLIRDGLDVGGIWPVETALAAAVVEILATPNDGGIITVESDDGRFSAHPPLIAFGGESLRWMSHSQASGVQVVVPVDRKVGEDERTAALAHQPEGNDAGQDKRRAAIEIGDPVREGKVGPATRHERSVQGCRDQRRVPEVVVGPDG